MLLALLLQVLERLKKVKFTKHGGIKGDKFGNMALKEFPSLIRLWEEKQNGE